MKTYFDHPGWIDALSDNYTVFRRDLQTLPPPRAADAAPHDRASAQGFAAIAMAAACTGLSFYCFLSVMLS